MDKNVAGLTAGQMVAYTSGRKSVPVAYVLGGLLGAFGAHRLYLGQFYFAMIFMVLLAVSLLGEGMMAQAAYFFLGVMCLIDLFLTYASVQQYNETLASKIRKEVD